MKKTLYTQETIDHETGEVKSSTWLRGENLTTDQFIRTYVEDIGILAKCSGAEISTVLCCLKYINYNTNEIILNPSRRREISICGSLKLSTVNVAISRLKKKNILIKTEDGLFFNPLLLFFGTDIARVKTVELTLTYKLEGK